MAADPTLFRVMLTNGKAAFALGYGPSPMPLTPKGGKR